jgi:Tfp pilus assembly protein PilW
MNLLRGQSGIVLNELLVAMVIGLAVLGAGVTSLTTFLGLNSRNSRQVQAADTARLAVDRLATQMRSAMSANSGTSQPVESASSYDIVFLVPSASASQTNNPRSLLHMRYCLDNTNPNDEALYVQTISYNSATQANPPSMTSCAGNTAWSTSTIVAKNLVNRAQSPAVPMFTTPTDSSGTYTDIGVNAMVDADTAKPPPATQLRSSITLRNVNHAPTAKLTCQLPTTGHAICDASGSDDPDGQSLSYTWFVDGTLQSSQTSYRMDIPSLSGGSHAFLVRVTDSGGRFTDQQCSTSSSCQAP